jgi:glycosyltransferase involved in cell wall biosynthesis
MPANALRGIGRWSNEFALAVVDRLGPSAVSISVSSQLQTPTILEQLHEVGLEVLTDGSPPACANELILFHAMSPMEDLPISTIWPKWARDPRVGLVTTLYDMIPMRSPNDYFTGRLRHPMRARYGMHRQADSVIGISKQAVEDGIELLGLDEARCFVASGGVSSRFVPRSTARSSHSLPSSLGITGGFVLSVGNVDPRKNLPTLISAFSALPRSVRGDRQLVITVSQGGDVDIAALRNHAESVGLFDELVLLTWVPDEFMVALYQHCEVMVFPSTSEGLGLPVMEAQACGAAVLVADRAPMSDLVGTESATFDPTSEADLAERLAWVFTDPDALVELRSTALRAAQQHSWTGSIGQVLAAYERALSR